MKKLSTFFIIVILFLFSAVFADTANNRKSGLLEGTFKKSFNGNFVQYDKHGKKIGVYKTQHGKFVRIK